MAELDCPPNWVSNEPVLCGSEGIPVGEAFGSETWGEVVVGRIPEVASFPESMTHVAQYLADVGIQAE